MNTALDFELPPELEAHEPPEMRGVARDGVRLLVSSPGDGHQHTTFSDLPAFLSPGDVLVINTSSTIPAAVPLAGDEDGHGSLLHLSTSLPGGLWLVELRSPAGFGTVPADPPATEPRTLTLAGGGAARLVAPYGGGHRLWFAELAIEGSLLSYLARWGQPVRYAYAGGAWPLSAYQNVYGNEPGSAELPSAGRPFTTDVLTRLVARGVRIAPLVLHTGVSSLEFGELPYPERYHVPLATAQLVNQTRREGGRVVAVGTTVVRALETVADDHGDVHPGDGWTELVVTPTRGVRAVGGLVTGWHPPQASHRLLLEAVAGRPLLEAAYAEAIAGRYHWHEFGDSHLLLP